MHLFGCQDLTQEWLQEVRENTDKYQEHETFEQTNIRVTVGNRIFDRKPYEEVHLEYGETGKNYHLRLGEDKKIVWCVMCFGRDAQLEPHLERAICLSHGLRRNLAPWLKRVHNISFANVMFVTEDSLDKASFQALSHFWSMKVVQLPAVHEDKIKNVSRHLKDENIRPEHVFLKYYTWTMASELAIISDVDVLVSNPQQLAAYLAAFFTDENIKKMQQEAGVSCMCRKKSTVGFSADFKPTIVRQKNPRRIDNLSYCFAIVTPNPDEAERYAEELKGNEGHIGKLSDQDHFSHFNRDVYVLLKQNIMAFISWWNHVDIMKNIVTGIIQLSVKEAPADQRKYYWTTMEFAESLFHKFGAVHCSSAFDVTRVERSQDDFVAEFTRRGNEKWKIPLSYKEENSGRIIEDTISISRKIWAKNFLWNMNVLCRKKSMEIVEKITTSIEKYTGYAPPEMGMSKAYFCLTRVLKRKEHPNWNSNLNPPDPTQDLRQEVPKVEVIEDSPTGEPDTSKGKKRKRDETHPWNRPRQKDSGARGSSEVIAPWREGRKKKK